MEEIPYKLSMPFARVTKTVVEKTADVANNIASGVAPKIIESSAFIQNVMKFVNKNKIIVLVVLASFAVFWFMYSNSQEEERGPTQDEIYMAEMSKRLPPEDPVQIGNQAYMAFMTSANIHEKHSSFGKAIYHYEESLRQAGPQLSGVLHYRLAKLYHEGVPETTDKSGESIQGIAPDANMAINHYKEAIRNGFHSAILDLASIYHWGLPGFNENRNKAKHLYGVMIKVGTKYEKALARDRLRQMGEEEGNIIGNGIEPAGSEGVSGGFSSNVFSSTPFHDQFMAFGESPENIGKDELTKGIDERLVHELITSDLHIANNRSQQDAVNEDVIPNDPHNARDHMVNTTARQALDKLRANTHIQYDIPMTLKMIHQYILEESDISESKKKNAIRVLQNSAKNLSKAGYEGAKELEALQLVWNRIQTKYRNSKQRMNLCNNLIGELAECVEYGEIVCPVGRLNRIIDTLNFVDPDVQIKPKWAIRKEMTQKAEKLRENLLKQCDGMTRDALDANDPTPIQKKLIKEFLQKLKRELLRIFHKEYVDKGIMSKELLEAEMHQWFFY